MAMPKTKVGNAMKASVMRITTESNTPPIYPDNVPRTEPITTLKATTAKAASTVVCNPVSTRHKMQRPSESVPIRNSPSGARFDNARLASSASCWHNKGATNENATISSATMP